MQCTEWLELLTMTKVLDCHDRARVGVEYIKWLAGIALQAPRSLDEDVNAYIEVLGRLGPDDYVDLNASEL